MEITAFVVEKLKTRVFASRQEMGAAAAKDAARRIKEVIAARGEANVIFAAAPSQNELLEGLVKSDVDWTKVRAFHMDEYIGISPDAPAGFGNFLRRGIFDLVPFKEVHYLLCRPEEAQEKCEAYAALLRQYPTDVILMGIGENGHLAFNDPGVADFEDPKMVKIVDLDDICRQQQVNDGCFPTFDDVPSQAMTLTMSFIMSVPQAVCVVPTDRKANAVYAALRGPVTTECPASILRTHPSATLYLDRDSAEKVL